MTGRLHRLIFVALATAGLNASVYAAESTKKEMVVAEATDEEVQLEPELPIEERELGFAETLDVALTYDPQLKRAYWNYEADKQEASIGYSKLLPNVRFSAAYQYEDSNNIYTDENSSFYNDDFARSGGEIEDNMWQLSLRQPLLNYPAYKNYQSTQQVVEGSKFKYERAEQEAIYRLSERYLGVLLAAQEVYLNQQKLDALNLKLTKVTRAKELGVGDELQILHAKSNRDLARSELIRAKSALVDAQTLLSHLTGFVVKYPQQWVRSSNEITPDFLTGTQDDWLALINNNARVKETSALIRKLQLDLEGKKGEHLPTIDLSVVHSDRDSQDEFRVRQGTTTSIELSMPIFSGGQTLAGVRKARAKVAATEAELDYIIKEKSQQIELSYNRLISFKERLAALAESRESGKKYLEAAERELSLNLSDQVNVSDARTQLIDVQLKFAQTLNDYLLSDLILRLESGKLDKSRLADYDSLFNAAVVVE